jgi:hypothetical protein
MLGLVLLAGAGCVQIGETTPTPHTPPTPLLPLGKDLTADQVTTQNAHAVAQRLWDQFDHDAQEMANPSKKGS